MDAFNKLEEIFRHFPGIGPRQAKRFVYHLLGQSKNDISEFTSLLGQLHAYTATCPECGRFFTISEAEKQAELISGKTSACSICRDQNRDRSILMIVSKDIDLLAMEKSRAFAGVYFVLGGNIPILDEAPELRIRQKNLLERVSSLSENSQLSEIILATSVNPEGDHTAQYLSSILRPLVENKARITTLGRGLSTGTELEYSDGDTLRSALENRRVSR